MTLVSELLILAGVIFTVVAAIGLHRFGDPFARMHAASKASPVGFLLIVAGVVLQRTSVEAVFELALAAVLMLVTLPVGLHLLARAAHRSGIRLAPGTTVDELAEAERRARAQGARAHPFDDVSEIDTEP